VVIPTNDTGDFLKQSKQEGSETKYNREAVTQIVKLPPFAADFDSDKVTVYAQCWNKFGQTRVETKTITLDNSKMKMT